MKEITVQTLHRKIREVLLKEWDPIGIQDIPEAQDEYDDYVRDVYSILIFRKPVSEMLEYLLWLETEHMGLTADKQRAQSIAEKLIALNTI